MEFVFEVLNSAHTYWKVEDLKPLLIINKNPVGAVVFLSNYHFFESYSQGTDLLSF